MQVATENGKKVIHMTIFDRIAFADMPTIRNAQSFLVQHGSKRAANQKELSLRLADVVAKKGEAVIGSFLALHPDAAMLEQKSTKLEKFDNDCGCHHSADGDQQALPEKPEKKNLPENREQKADYMPALIITSLVMVTIISIASMRS